MHKDELIYLHSLMVKLRLYFEENDMHGDFTSYDNMHISPVHVHRSKNDHKQAIFLLSEGLAEMVADNTNIHARIHQLVETVSAGR